MAVIFHLYEGPRFISSWDRSPGAWHAVPASRATRCRLAKVKAGRVLRLRSARSTAIWPSSRTTSATPAATCKNAGGGGLLARGAGRDSRALFYEGGMPAQPVEQISASRRRTDRGGKFLTCRFLAGPIGKLGNLPATVTYHTPHESRADWCRESRPSSPCGSPSGKLPSRRWSDAPPRTTRTRPFVRGRADRGRGDRS